MRAEHPTVLADLLTPTLSTDLQHLVINIGSTQRVLLTTIAFTRQKMARRISSGQIHITTFPIGHLNRAAGMLIMVQPFQIPLLGDKTLFSNIRYW